MYLIVASSGSHLHLEQITWPMGEISIRIEVIYRFTVVTVTRKMSKCLDGPERHVVYVPSMANLLALVM